MNISQSTYRIFIIILILSFAVSCVSKKYLAIEAEADKQLSEQNYQEALVKYESIINEIEVKNKLAKPVIYSKAGICAYDLNQKTKAEKYMSRAFGLNYKNEELFYKLSKIYQELDNLSKELDVLKSYKVNYSDGKNIDSINYRLLVCYTEMQEWQKTDTIWAALPEEMKNDVNSLEIRFKNCVETEKNKESDEIAKRLLNLNKNNITALEHFGKKYYWKAENLYQREMNAYERNKTTRQYKKLLKALKVVSANFRMARSYYLRLYKQNPAPEHAKYLANIYARLNDKRKSNYYRAKSKQ